VLPVKTIGDVLKVALETYPPEPPVPAKTVPVKGKTAVSKVATSRKRATAGARQ
jgi:hypothetical protein